MDGPTGLAVSLVMVGELLAGFHAQTPRNSRCVMMTSEIRSSILSSRTAVGLQCSSRLNCMCMHMHRDALRRGCPSGQVTDNESTPSISRGEAI